MPEMAVTRTPTVVMPVAPKYMVTLQDGGYNHVGNGMRVGNYLVTNTHVAENSQFIVGPNGATRDISGLEWVTSSMGIDLSYQQFSSGVFSELGVSKSTVRGKARPCSVTVVAFDGSQWVQSTGRMISRGERFGYVYHTANTDFGHSGGAVLCNGGVIGIHRGRNMLDGKAMNELIVFDPILAFEGIEKYTSKGRSTTRVEESPTQEYDTFYTRGLETYSNFKVGRGSKGKGHIYSYDDSTGYFSTLDDLDLNEESIINKMEDDVYRSLIQQGFDPESNYLVFDEAMELLAEEQQKWRSRRSEAATTTQTNGKTAPPRSRHLGSGGKTMRKITGLL